MSEKQARRPPVAPKPWFIHQDAATVKISPLPSPALQGATTAFGPGPVKVSNAASSQTPSAGALLAATAAASRRQQSQQQGQTAQKNSQASQDASPTSRGRQPAVRSVPLVAATRSSASPPKPTFSPYPPQSSSAAAAVAASAATSPVRKPAAQEEFSTLYPSKLEPVEGLRHRSTSTSSTYSDAAPSLGKSPDALAGAIASMANVPARVQGKADDMQRTDLSAISHLLLAPSQSSTGSSVSPSPSGTVAAALATRNAANAEARKRTQSVSGESVLTESYSGIPSLSPPTATTGSRWPRIRLTPPETDSESESLRAVQPEPNPETPRKPLPAPIPLRPARAAIVAQDNANSNMQTIESPVLDARTKMTASSLADAMVASSLASRHSASRGASPVSKPPPPPPRSRRRSRSASLFDGSKQHLPFLGRGFETTPQTPKLKPRPQRPMRQTMRDPSSDYDEKEDEHAKRGRRHWRRHPNMHHEGDRKRWWDRVTERERKRYEGVWAANRGLLIHLDQAILDAEAERTEPSEPSEQQQQQPPPMQPPIQHKNASPPGDLVANVVVRDIWERSRLPKDVLEEVWDLVAQPGSKALNREEFVVGLWLIDQRLKGRKLPIKVSPSVWQSVRHPQGVKIRNKRR